MNYCRIMVTGIMFTCGYTYNSAVIIDLITFISKLMLSKCIKQWCETSPYCLCENCLFSFPWDFLCSIFCIQNSCCTSNCEIVVLSVCFLSFEIFLFNLLYEISIAWSNVVLFVLILEDFYVPSTVSEWFIYNCSPQGVSRQMLFSAAWHSAPHPSQN